MCARGCVCTGACGARAGHVNDASNFRSVSIQNQVPNVRAGTLELTSTIDSEAVSKPPPAVDQPGPRARRCPQDTAEAGDIAAGGVLSPQGPGPQAQAPSICQGAPGPLSGADPRNLLCSYLMWTRGERFRGHSLVLTFPLINISVMNVVNLRTQRINKHIFFLHATASGLFRSTYGNLSIGAQFSKNSEGRSDLLRAEQLFRG